MSPSCYLVARSAHQPLVPPEDPLPVVQGAAEVPQLADSRAGHQHVGSLHVQVQHSSQVTVLQGVTYLQQLQCSALLKVQVDHLEGGSQEPGPAKALLCPLHQDPAGTGSNDKVRQRC